VSLTVTLVGGESTGKSRLAEALHRHLGEAGLNCRLVPEHLRGWCEAQGRAPHASEQAALAAEQNRRIVAAAAQPGVDVVVADTTALVVAAYSAHYFDDASLFPAALAQQREFGLTLLMGLDLPWEPDGLFRDSAAVRKALDALLRRELQAAQLPFHTVYGQGAARLQMALRTVGARLGRVLVASEPEWGNGRVTWNCENCSDPACEHRLFSRLVQGEP
jgi:HTH-type transcriptional regulator, transcriptional repressor of NAD biosynthesis genes